MPEDSEGFEDAFHLFGEYGAFAAETGGNEQEV